MLRLLRRDNDPGLHDHLCPQYAFWPLQDGDSDSEDRGEEASDDDDESEAEEDEEEDEEDEDVEQEDDAASQAEERQGDEEVDERQLIEAALAVEGGTGELATFTCIEMPCVR